MPAHEDRRSPELADLHEPDRALGALVVELSKRGPTTASQLRLPTPRLLGSSLAREAQLQCKTRTEFMLEAPREKAQQVLFDQTLFSVSPKQYKAFVALMDAPLGKNVPLQRLLAKRAPWE